jgi:hypothetical protein
MPPNWPSVLISAMPPHLVRLQTGIHLLPAIEGLLRNANMTNQLGHRQARFGLFQHRHNLLDTEAFAFHRTAPFNSKSPPKTRLHHGTVYWGAAHSHRRQKLKSRFHMRADSARLCN